MKSITDTMISEGLLFEEMSEETKRIKAQKDSVYRKLRRARIAGKDMTALQAEYDDLTNQYEASKKNDAAGISSQPSQTSSGSANNGSQDYKDGYQVAINMAKKIASGDLSDIEQAAQQAAQQNGGGSSSGSGGSDNGLEMPIPPGMSKAVQDAIKKGMEKGKKAAQQNGNGSGSDQGDDQQRWGGQKAGSTTRDSQRPEDKGKNVGQVRPEDCGDMAGSQAGKELDNTPSQAGGMVSKETGDAINDSEGYDHDSSSQKNAEESWKKDAKQAAQKMAGKNPGLSTLSRKISGTWNTIKDWRKELRKLVGQCINPDEGRSAYANKNALVSQSRITRATKDNYNAMSYIAAFIDTSGSMDVDWVVACLREVYGVAEAKKPMTLITCQIDTKIQDFQEFHGMDEFKRYLKKPVKIHGQGGTDFKDIWTSLRKDKRFTRHGPAELAIIFTDGYVDQIKRDPRTMQHLIWVVVDNVSFELQYKDIRTKVIRITKEQMENK